MLEREPCSEWMERVSAYADEELEEAEKQEVEAHLDECNACREWLGQVRADAEALAGALLRPKRRWGFARAVIREVGKRPAYEQPANATPRRWRFTAVELAVSCVVICVCAAVLLPCFSKARERARQVRSGGSLRTTAAQLRQAACSSNVKQICLALRMYASDQGALPPLEGWPDAILPYLGTRAILVCPQDKEADLGYAYNPAVAGEDLKTIDDPAKTVMVYDARDGKLEQRHDDGAYYGFADAEVKWLEDPPPGFLDQQSLGPPTRNYGLAEKLRIAYEAEQDVEVEDVPVAVMQAEDEIDQRGGFLLNSDLARNSDCLTAQIVFRVPLEELLATMNALARLGAVVNRHITGEDLTEKYVLAERAVQSEAQKQERLGRIERRTRQTAEKLELAKKVDASHAAAEQQRSEIRQVLARTVLATGAARFLEREEVLPRTLAGTAERAWQSSGRTGRVVATAAIWLLAYLPFWGAALAALLLGRRCWLRRRA